MKSMAARRSTLYLHVAAKAKATALELGLAEEVAEHLGAAVADGLAEDFSGEVISFPKEEAYRFSQRERLILDERAKGASLAELARHYQMTERGVRKLLSRAKARGSVSIEQLGLI